MKLSLSLLLSATVSLAATNPEVRPHPRLQVDAALLHQIKSMRDANDPAWARFYKWTSRTSAETRSFNLIYANMLLFLIDGDQKPFDTAWQAVRAKIYRNGQTREGGLTKLLDLFHGEAHMAAFQGGPFLATIAHFYDWGYARLSDEQKKDLIDWINDAAAYTAVENKSSHAFLRNDGAAATYGIAAAAYATLGENPQAGRILGWFRSNWSEIVKGLDIMGMGGAAGEGNAYGASPTAFHFIATANLVYYASGEDLFLSHVWFRKRLLYDAFAAYPGTIGGKGSPGGYPDTPIIEQASIGGDGRRAASWHSAALRPNGLILSRRFAGTEEASIWNWVYRQPAVDHPTDDGQSVYDLLYYAPKPKLVKPSRLSYFDPSMGFVYIRSDWDSPDATWIAFWAGPHIDTHEHLDQGAFTIFKRRDLAPKTGHYDNDSVKSSHHLSYYTRTVSSNGILVGDPKEVFRNFIAGMGCDANGKGDRVPAPDNSSGVCIANDGGQRTMSPNGMAVHDAETYYKSKDTWDVARVASFEDNGVAVSVVADITNAYNNPRYSTPGNAPKVNGVYRRLVYLREPGLLLVADTVESTDAKFEKKWLLHALDRMEVGGDVEKVSVGETVHTHVDQVRIVVDDTDPSDKRQTTFDLRTGYAALIEKTLFPVNFRYRVVGGREPADTPDADLYGSGKNAGHFHRHEKDFWVKDFSEGTLPGHKSLNWAPAFPIESFAAAYIPVYGPGYGRWRLELEPAEAHKVDYFLNVLEPTLNPAAALPPMRRIETGDTFGAEIDAGGKRYRVAFPKDTLGAPQVGVSR